jgi:hypothetical protein
MHLKFWRQRYSEPSSNHRLAAIANTEYWPYWGRHFGLPSRLAPQIKDARHRYVLTALHTAAAWVPLRPPVISVARCPPIYCPSLIGAALTLPIWTDHVEAEITSEASSLALLQRLGGPQVG